LHLARNKVRLANFKTALAVRGQANNAQPVCWPFRDRGCRRLRKRCYYSDRPRRD
jgi:hypothetical protein